MSTEHAQSEHSSQVAVDALEKEKEQLKAQLEKQVQENIQLVKYACRIRERKKCWKFMFCLYHCHTLK